MLMIVVSHHIHVICDDRCAPSYQDGYKVHNDEHINTKQSHNNNLDDNYNMIIPSIVISSPIEVRVVAL